MNSTLRDLHNAIERAVNQSNELRGTSFEEAYGVADELDDLIEQVQGEFIYVSSEVEDMEDELEDYREIVDVDDARQIFADYDAAEVLEMIEQAEAGDYDQAVADEEIESLTKANELLAAKVERYERLLKNIAAVSLRALPVDVETSND